ncbi:MAG: hypothetical protein Q4E47_02460 [Candidatus Saccharibacteria bacterium]|nr:hypothetical protein [Candidatus Saccharibacteria bacterium]
MSKGKIKSDWDSLEIQTGKRTKKYRFFEMLPGILSYGMIILLFVLSFVMPMLGSIYLLIIITTTLVKAIGVAYRTVQGYNTVQKAENVDWHARMEDLEEPHEAYERLSQSSGKALTKQYGFDEHLDNLLVMAANGKADDDKFPDPKEVIHAVIMTAYNEGLKTLVPSVEAVRDTSFPNERIIFILGYEERGGEEMEKTAKELKEKFKDTFKEFMLVKHPVDLPDEIQGKGPNLCYAGKALEKYCEQRHIRPERVVVTSLDSDNRMSKSYLDYVAYEYIVRPDRQRLSYQPVSIFMNNIWEAKAPMRIIAISNSFFNIISTMRPHTLKNFASHSQPLAALIDMNFWSKRTIVEDGHQYWRSLFHFHGKYEVVPIHVPMYQDAVMEETFWKTLKAQFIQLRRWDYGASDVAYVGVRLFSKDRKTKGKMDFFPLFCKFVRLLDGHVMLAAMSPIVAFGGWVPRLVNYDSRNMITVNLPNTVSAVQTVAAIGLMVTIVISLRMIPPRPKNPTKLSKLKMVVQWVLMPVVAIAYQSAAAFYSQTRLFIGKYMEKFDVTKKM